MKDVYEQMYYQPHIQDQPPPSSSSFSRKTNSSSSGGSTTVLGRFLKLGKSKSDVHGSSHSHSSHGSNLKSSSSQSRRATPSEFEDDFRLSPSQLRGVERMVHKANLRKDVSRSHSWIFGSVKLPSDYGHGHGYDTYGGGGFEIPTPATMATTPTSKSAVAEYSIPHQHNIHAHAHAHAQTHIPRCSTAAEDFCCSCDYTYTEDFNFQPSQCKACHGGPKLHENRKPADDSSKKFASSVRKLTWKSLKQAVRKRPSLDSLNLKKAPTEGCFSHEDLLSPPSSSYFFPDKKSALAHAPFYASCTDLHAVDGEQLTATATASVRVRPKRSRQSWHFPTEFGPIPNYQETEDSEAMYHSEWDLRQYMPMPYEEWLNTTSPSSNGACATGKSPMGDFEACFDPPTSVRVQVAPPNGQTEGRKRNGSRGAAGNSNSNSPADMYSNGGVKRFSILSPEASASAYALNQHEDSDEDEDARTQQPRGEEQVRIAGQGIFMMNGPGCLTPGGGVKLARNNSSSSGKANLSRSNHTHHLLLSSADGVWSDTQGSEAHARSNSRERERERVETRVLESHQRESSSNLNLTTFQQTTTSASTFLGHTNHYAAPNSNLNSSGENGTGGNGYGYGVANASNAKIREFDGGNLNNNHYSSSEIQNTTTARPPAASQANRRENGYSNGNNEHASNSDQVARKNGNSTALQGQSKSQNPAPTSSESGKTKGGDSGNKYGALRRRKGRSSGLGKTLLRETIYEEESELAEQDGEAAESAEVYSVKIVVSQNGGGDYVKPILKNRSHYASPNVNVSSSSSALYQNSEEITYDAHAYAHDQQFRAHEQSHTHNANGNDNVENGGGSKTRKKVQFHSEQVFVCGGTSEPELDEEGEEMDTDAHAHAQNDENEVDIQDALSSSSECVVMAEYNFGVEDEPLTSSEMDGDVRMRNEISIGAESGSGSAEIGRENNGREEEEEVVQVSRGRVEMMTTASSQVNNLKPYTNGSAGAYNTSRNGSNQPGNEGRTSSGAMMNTGKMKAQAQQTQANSTTTPLPTTMMNEDPIQKSTPAGKNERIGVKEQQISKVKGCQPQRILNPNSLLFNDTTRIRLNQARPSLEQTFKLNFGNEEQRNNRSNQSKGMSPPNRRVKTSHSFRGSSANLVIPLRPKEPPPPPPIPHRVLPPIPSTAAADSSTKSNGRAQPTQKSQISLPMPMLGFSTTNHNVKSGKGLPNGNSNAENIQKVSGGQGHSIISNPRQNTAAASQTNRNSNKSSALTQKCEALEKVLSQNLKLAGSANGNSSPTPKGGKTNSIPARPAISSHAKSHPSQNPPLRPPPINPKPSVDVDSKFHKSKSNRPEQKPPSGPPQAKNERNSSTTATDSQNIEIVTKENSVSEIRIYSGTQNHDAGQKGGKNENSSQPSHTTPIKEIHYAATDLFQKENRSGNSIGGTFNYESSTAPESCMSSSRPQSTSVVMIMGTGSSESDAVAAVNSIAKSCKPTAPAHAKTRGDLLDLHKVVPAPTYTHRLDAEKIEGTGVGQSQTRTTAAEVVVEDEPVYDDVQMMNGSLQVEHVRMRGHGHKTTTTIHGDAKTGFSPEPMTTSSPSPPPVPQCLPPPSPIGDIDDDNENDNFYNDVGIGLGRRNNNEPDGDEDSGTCVNVNSDETLASLSEDIIYDDTLSVISHNYDVDPLKITTTGSESKAKMKFSPVINHSKTKAIKSINDAQNEDEPMYDDVLNLMSTRNGNNPGANQTDSDSGTETDAPPPLPASGPPVHLLPKISLELPLIPLPITGLNQTKKSFGEKIQDFGKKIHGNDTNSKLSKNEITAEISSKKPDNLLNEIRAAAASRGLKSAGNPNPRNDICQNQNQTMTVATSNQNGDGEDDVLDRTRSLLNELNEKLSKLSFQPDYSSYVSKVVISSSSDSSGVEEDYNSEKNYSLSNGSDAASASSGEDSYKLSAVSKLVTETISMARGKFLDSMKLNQLGGSSGGTPSPISDVEEPIYEEIHESNGRSADSSSPIYSDAFDAKSIFDGASRNEILSFLESIRDRLTNGTTTTTVAESSPIPLNGSSAKKVRKFGEIERNDSGIGSESGSLVAIGGANGKNGRVLESICKDCNDAPVDPRIIPSSGSLDCEDSSCSSVDVLGAGDAESRAQLQLCRSCSRKRSERKEIILEIYETEMKYGRDLRIVADEFFTPIQVAGLLTKEQLDSIFLNVPQLIQMNGELTGHLKTAIDEAIGSQDEDLSSVTIGRIFLEIGEKMMSAFESYCTRQASAGALLTQLEKEKELLRIFLRVSQMENAVLRRMNLPAFLMVPVQRVTRYPLLLSRLLKVTCADHPSREELQTAHEKIEQHLEHMNKTTREVASVKLWRRISIINGSSSPVHRRSSSDLDGANVRIRKMAFDVLDWANFSDVTCVIENQLNIVNLNGKALRNIYGCLLARGKDLDTLVLKMEQDVFFPPPEDVVKDVKLVLVRVKNTRFCLLREPLCLSKCIVSLGENEFQDYIEINEIPTKNTYYIQAMDKPGTLLWLRLLQCHAVCVGQWRRRRPGLANIMMNGMIRHL